MNCPDEVKQQLLIRIGKIQQRFDVDFAVTTFKLARHLSRRENDRCLQHIAWLKYQQKQYHDALYFCLKCRKYTATTQYIKGMVFVGMGKVEKGLSKLRSAVKLDKRAVFMTSLGVVLYNCKFLLEMTEAILNANVAD